MHILCSSSLQTISPVKNVLWFLLVGVITTLRVGVLVKGGGFGLIGDLVVGIIGALIGGLLFSGLDGAAGGGSLGSIVVATLGAVILFLSLPTRISSSRSCSGFPTANQPARAEAPN